MKDTGDNVGRSQLVVIGPSGCGKSTFGRALAIAINAQFIDADDHHSSANKAKMARGEGLNDADRSPWLDTLCELLHTSEAPRIVLACSALKETYRLTLKGGPRQVEFLFLQVPREVLAERLKTRAGHFATESLLDSQLETLEEPTGAWTLDGTKSIEQLVLQVQESLNID